MRPRCITQGVAPASHNDRQNLPNRCERVLARSSTPEGADRTHLGIRLRDDQRGVEQHCQVLRRPFGLRHGGAGSTAGLPARRAISFGRAAVGIPAVERYRSRYAARFASEEVSPAA